MTALKRILVIDDDETVGKSCRRILSERGYDVEIASTGAEGLERAHRGYFDCALVDLKMPDMDGMEIVRTARRNRSRMAVLIITGYGAVETASAAMRLGVSDYITKPFTPEEIARAVHKAVARAPEMTATDALDRIVEQIERSAPTPDLLEHRSPQAVADMVTRGVGVKKATASVLNTVILGILAGVYIGFGAALATLVAHDAPATFGVGAGQVLTGSVFCVGLVLVVIAGAELFTGNNLMMSGVLGRQYRLGRMLGRWAIVYAANLAGSVLLVVIMYKSGLWRMASSAVGTKALAIAGAKVNLPFGEAFFRGVGCNWLVCLAVWMALAAKDIAGKVLVIYFPIMAFVALGFEHCVANMYFIPMGILLKGSSAATSFGGALDSLTWTRFVTANLIPVTLGNIVGGAIFVATAYWWTYVRHTAGGT